MNTKKVSLFLLLTIALLSLAACQGETEVDPIITEPIEVTFGTHPEENISRGDSVEIFVEVTQEGRPIDDADEVVFEFWHEDDDTEEDREADGDATDMSKGMYREGTETVPATHQGKGIYSIERTFDKEGVHFIMFHVTAQGYHAMKTNEVHIQ